MNGLDTLIYLILSGAALGIIALFWLPGRSDK